MNEKENLISTLTPATDTEKKKRWENEERMATAMYANHLQIGRGKEKKEGKSYAKIMHQRLLPNSLLKSLWKKKFN